jgi:cytidine deaminase
MAYLIATWLDQHSEVIDPARPIDDAEHIQRYQALREHLALRSNRARAQAVSWRNFNVGCAVYAWRPWDQQEHPWDYFSSRWCIFTGANIKPRSDVATICAEQVAILAAIQAGYSRIIGLSVVGPLQADSVSGLEHKTLHPCGLCRAFFRAQCQITGETRVLTGGIQSDLPDNIYVEELTVTELLRIHHEPPTVT